MSLQSIISELANQADDLLVDAANHKEAKQTIAEHLTKKYPKLNGVERQKISDAVIEILDEEGFFDGRGSGDSWSEGGEDGDEE